MSLINQLIIRVPKWTISWVLFTMDCAVGFLAIKYVFNDVIGSFQQPFWLLFGITHCMWGLIFWFSNLYRGDPMVSRFGETENLVRITLIPMITGIFFLGIDIDMAPITATLIIRYWVMFTAFTVGNRWIIRSFQKYLLRKGFGQHRALIIGTGHRAKYAANNLISHEQMLFTVTGFVETIDEPETKTNLPRPILGRENDLRTIIKRNPVSDIIIALDNMEHGRVMDLVSNINGTPVSVKIVPDLYEVISGLARTEQITGLPLIDIDFKEGYWAGSGMKRVFDLIISLPLCIMLLPVWTIIAVAIKINSKGPVFYNQERLGLNSGPFMIHKFRSMVPGAEDKSGPIWASDEDPRITSMGRFLRRFRLDEIPQLINVLKGEMSLIGPRPERPFFVERLREEYPLYDRRFRMRPGITGWSQIKHPSDRDVEDVRQKLKYDFYYIENVSFNLDMKILLNTVVVVLSGKGR